jgi:hypothetical protein
MRWSVLVRPKWLGLHLLTLVAVAACALLGRWQFDKALWESGDLVNLGYGLQWWSFAAIILFGWWRGARDAVRGDAPRRAQPGREAAPQRVLRVPARPSVSTEEDAELAAYNAYLARLNARARSS